MNEDDVVDIVDPDTNEVVSHCVGPTAQGGCPGSGPDGVVLCAGCRIDPHGAGPEYWNLWVPPGSKQCPRGWNLDQVGY
jgi:hypothetical protein